MKDKNAIYRSLIRSKPFIYIINNQHYYIGESVFRCCTAEEVILFSQYCQELDFLDGCAYPLERTDAEKLSSVVEAILSAGDCEHSDTNATRTNAEINTILEECSTKEIESLTEQKERFLKALDYKDGAFYRHLKHYGKDKG